MRNACQVKLLPFMGGLLSQRRCALKVVIRRIIIMVKNTDQYLIFVGIGSPPSCLLVATLLKSFKQWKVCLNIVVFRW
jgi:hypothetical protein